jgi:hypothetical protein
MASQDLKHRVLAYMADPDTEPFPALAFDVFGYQWERNAALRGLLEERGVDPAAIRTLEELPAVSTAAFKALRFTTGTPTIVFRTSGTTRGAGGRGAHHLVDADLYRESLSRSFREYVLHDSGPGELDFLVLAPSATWAPDSSLGFMMDEVVSAYGGPGSRFLLGPGGLDRDAAFEALARAEAEGRPALVLATAFALVHLLDALAAAGLRFRLPAGSRIMDTGGFKGRSRELRRGELLSAYESLLGVPRNRVVNEYGMTELGSQFYDASLRGGDPDVKMAPHWVQVLVIDPATGRPAPPGEVGLLRFIDLANLDSVAVVETEDLGRLRGDGFELLGRAALAEPRGCSLATEELLEGGAP